MLLSVFRNPRGFRQISVAVSAFALVVSAELAANPILLPVGDSITRGFSTPPQVSYREELVARLTASGCTPTMRGSQSTSTNSSLHEGYSGHRAEDFLDGRAANPGIETTMDIYSPATDPADAVLLHIGTNDILRPQTASSTLGEIQQIIDLIHDESPTTVVYIANVVPLYVADSDGDGILDVTDSEADALSNGIDSAYANYSGIGDVSLVDVRTGFRPTDMVSDGIHPSEDDTSDPRSDSGEHRIAVAFAAALEDGGECNPTPASDVSFPLTDILTPVEDESITGPLMIAGKATDTGGSGFDRVRLAILDNNLSLIHI